MQGCPTFVGEGPQELVWAVSRAARVKTALSGIPNRLNCCIILIISEIYKYDREPPNTRWCAGGWTPLT